MSKYDKYFGKDWAKRLTPALESDAYKKIGKELKGIVDDRKKLYPVFDNMFSAFRNCPYNKLNTVFLTTNTYEEFMDGMAFSATKAEFASDRPKVLDKVFDAIEEDVANGLYLLRDNDLTRWAEQGVLLLNLDLSNVKGAKAGEHIDLWKPFINYVLKLIHTNFTGINFVLIGKEAAKYESKINKEIHNVHVLEHPMIAVVKNRPWNYNKVFSAINGYLQMMNGFKINWTIPNIPEF
jgi:uracil-DNA glycosylase